MDSVRHAFEWFHASMVRYLMIVYLLSVSAAAASAEPPRALSDAVQSYIYQYMTDIVSDETFRFSL